MHLLSIKKVLGVFFFFAFDRRSFYLKNLTNGKYRKSIIQNYCGGL